MTYEQLREIARKRGAVYWLRAGKIEYLRIAKKNEVVVATRFLPKRTEHAIMKPADTGHQFFCIPIQHNQMIQVRDLIWD